MKEAGIPSDDRDRLMGHRPKLLAGELAEAILVEEEVQRAVMLRRLVAERSPFALVRAVDLAELILSAGIAANTPAWRKS